MYAIAEFQLSVKHLIHFAQDYWLPAATAFEYDR